MIIQVDSREKARAIRKIEAEFDRNGILHPVSKLLVGDYMNYDNPRLVIDRKQNLSELCANVCQQHERFRRELTRAQENGIRIVILCEHGKDIRQLSDVIWWKNPRSTQRILNPENGRWETIRTKAMGGDVLYKILNTISRKYGVQYDFCTKEETGKRIIEILGGGIRDE